jgi:hypothetical protein
VRKVIRESSREERLAELLSEMRGLDRLRAAVAPFMGNIAYSSNTFRAVLILAALPQDGSERTLTELATELGLSLPVVHRYVGSWMVLGMVCQDPDSRRYRRALVTSPVRIGATGTHD